MNLIALTSAIIQLDRAFDVSKAPGGAAFWYEIRNRLLHYRKVANGEFPAPTPSIIPVPSWLSERPLKTFPTLNGFHTYRFGMSLDLAMTWASTVEGSAYWRAVKAFLTDLAVTSATQLSCVGLLRESQVSRFGEIDLESERYQLHTENRFTPAAFRNNIWYRPGMWPHHDPEEMTLLRYVPKGKAKFVSARPGKFLATYYGDVLTETEIADLAAKFRATGEPPKLMFAETADEIAWVYKHGPSSCMSSGKNVDGIESVRAYASPDLKLAYLLRDGKPTARALVRPDKFAFSKIYGDAVSLKAALKKAKYVHDAIKGTAEAINLFRGVRLTAIIAPGQRPAHLKLEETNEPVCITPFFDLPMHAYFNREDGFLYVGGPRAEGQKEHRLKGGYSIHAIPKDGPIPTVKDDYGNKVIKAIFGNGGVNQVAYLRFSDAGRKATPAKATPAQESHITLGQLVEATEMIRAQQQANVAATQQTTFTPIPF